MLKKIIIVIVALLTINNAQAQSGCWRVGYGYIGINHRVGLLVGGNFQARVSCTRGAPTLVLWRGGSMCPGRYFYGTNGFGQRFSCLVRSISSRRR